MFYGAVADVPRRLVEGLLFHIDEEVNLERELYQRRKRHRQKHWCVEERRSWQVVVEGRVGPSPRREDAQWNESH
jgi:hypothetical protein